MHDFGEFLTVAMTMKLRNTYRGIILLALGLSACVWAQDAAPSLGDVARKSRKEHASAAHQPARQVTNEEEDGPDAGGVWRVRLCSRTPCYELSIALPKSPKWIRPAAQPRPALIPIQGHEDDLSHAIRVYAAESITAISLDAAKRAFLQGWFARPEYFGQAARLVLDERGSLDGSLSTITHFTVLSGGIKFRGLGVIANTINGDYGFACVFRDEDTSVAGSICDGIIKSARNQVLDASRRIYPTYIAPTYYYPPAYPARRYDDPPVDPQDDYDPE